MHHYECRRRLPLPLKLSSILNKTVFLTFPTNVIPLKPVILRYGDADCSKFYPDCLLLRRMDTCERNISLIEPLIAIAKKRKREQKAKPDSKADYTRPPKDLISKCAHWIEHKGTIIIPIYRMIMKQKRNLFHLNDASSRGKVRRSVLERPSVSI